MHTNEAADERGSLLAGKDGEEVRKDLEGGGPEGKGPHAEENGGGTWTEWLTADSLIESRLAELVARHGEVGGGREGGDGKADEVGLANGFGDPSLFDGYEDEEYDLLDARTLNANQKRICRRSIFSATTVAALDESELHAVESLTKQRAKQAGLFFLSILVFSIMSITDQIALYNPKTERKEINFIVQTPLIVSHIDSILLIIILLYYFPSLFLPKDRRDAPQSTGQAPLPDGTHQGGDAADKEDLFRAGLHQLFDWRQIGGYCIIALGFGVSDQTNLLVQRSVDAALWKVISQIKLPLMALASFVFVSKRSTLTQCCLLCLLLTITAVFAVNAQTKQHKPLDIPDARSETTTFSSDLLPQLFIGLVGILASTLSSIGSEIILKTGNLSQGKQRREKGIENDEETALKGINDQRPNQSTNRMTHRGDSVNLGAPRFLIQWGRARIAQLIVALTFLVFALVSTASPESATTLTATSIQTFPDPPLPALDLALLPPVASASLQPGANALLRGAHAIGSPHQALQVSDPQMLDPRIAELPSQMGVETDVVVISPSKRCGGFFRGWGVRTWLLVAGDLLRSAIAALLVKKMDSVWKSLASALSIGAIYVIDVTFNPTGAKLCMSQMLLVIALSLTVITYAAARRDQRRMERCRDAVEVLRADI